MIDLRAPTVLPHSCISWGGKTVKRHLSTAGFILAVALAEVFEVRAQPFQFKHLTADEGLSGSSIMAILQDQRGYIWFGTSDGLDRYDGYEFTSFTHDPSDSSSLSHNWIWSLCEDHEGNIWIGTRIGSLDKFDPLTGTFERVDLHLREARSPGPIYAIHEDRNGILWIGTGNEGLKRYDRRTGILTSFRHDPADPSTLSDAANAVWVIHEDRAGRLWIGTWGGGLNRFDPTTESFRSYQPDPTARHNTIQSVEDAGEGRLWVGTEHSGLYLFDPDRDTFTRASLDLQSNHIKGLHRDRLGWLWIGTWGAGLYRYDHATGTLARATHRPGDSRSLSENRVLGLYADRVGNLWVPTYDTGVSRMELETGSFSAFVHDPNDPESLGPGRVWSIYEDRKGEVWLGTRSGMARYVPNSGSFEEIPGTPSVLSIAEDAEGRLWLGTGSEGLLRYDARTHVSKLYRYNAANRTGNHVRVVEIASDDKIWFGTWGWGLFRLDDTTDELTRFMFDSSLPENTVTAIHEDRAGRLWIGTWEHGLFLFERQTESFRRFDSDAGAMLDATTVWTLHEDRYGRIWTGTSDGLHVIDPATGQVEHFNRHKSDLPHNDVRAILEDRRGRFWISTGLGISRYDPETDSFKNFDVEDGLVGNDLSPNAAFASRSGTLYFGESSGLVAFDPDAIRENPYPPQVVITDFRLFNQPVVPGPNSPLDQSLAATTSIPLAHSQNDLSFSYVGLHFSRPERNQYAYVLEGYEDDWRMVGPQRTAIYPNLPPGKYVFRVRAANSDGVWSTEAAEVGVVVHRPWWQAWWAYAFYCALFLVGFFALDRIQKRRLIARERKRAEIEGARIRAEAAELNARTVGEHAKRLEELDVLKSRFFANVSHELRTPLTLILGPITQAQRDGDAERLLGHVPMMTRSAARLLELIGQILDLARLEAGGMHLRARRIDLVPFLRDLVLSFSGRTERVGLLLLFDTREKELAGYFDVDKLEKVVSNLVSNAVKFTDPGGKVRVGLQRREEGPSGVADITIADTGIGIPDEEIDRIFDRFHQVDASATRLHEGAGIGLALVKELVTLHRGTIHVESKRGFGTTFRISLPLGTSHLAPSELVPDAEEGVPSDRSKSRDRALESDQLPSANDAPDASPKEVQGLGTSGMPADETADGSTRPLILVVDDNVDVRRYLVSLLAHDYRVAEAADGAVALELAREAAPDMVLADLMMPGMDGYDLCRSIKEDEALGHIPIVILTARADDQSRLESLGLGADDYLQKPFQPDELLVRVENLIELRRRLRDRFSRKLIVGPSEIVVPSSEEAFLHRVQEVVESHLGDSGFGVAQAADEVGLSRRQLGRRLKTAIGVSPGGYIRMMRLERAAQLLKQQAGTVQEIAYRVGFNDTEYFSKIFRQAFGVTPSIYPSDEQSSAADGT